MLRLFLPLLCILVLVAAGRSASPVYAASVTVNSTVDAVDANPGDGVCADANGKCTLRAAIMEANALPGAQKISLPAGDYVLTIPGTGEDAGATGDLDIASDLTVVGSGVATTIIDGGGLDTVLDVAPGAQQGPPCVPPSVNVAIEGLTVRNGHGGSPLVGGSAAGIRNSSESNLSVSDSAVTNNSGPGISSAGTLTIERTTVSANIGGVLSDGDGCGNAHLLISQSTIAGNDGVGVSSTGGTGTTVVNSTISGNSADGLDQIGGGTTLSYSTVTDNGKDGAFGAGVQFRGTIVSNNAGGNCGIFEPAPPFTSLDYNVDSDGTCGLAQPHDLSGVNPKLGPLADNGGPTQTHALLLGSPAIDAGDNVDCPAMDQRGVSRPQGASCDIGAFELEGGAGLKGAVLFINGIASQSRYESILGCGVTTPGFIQKDGNPEASWIADYLSDPSHVGGLSLQQDKNFFYFSYSGLYCLENGVDGVEWDYRRPTYGPPSSCGAVGPAADKLQAMLTELITRNPQVKFDIVTHSLGGLVASYWLSQHGDMRNRVNSIITFDSPLRGVPLAILTALYPCDPLSGAWKDMECLDDRIPAVSCSAIIPAIGSDALTTPFFTLDATELDSVLGVKTPFEFVPGDRTTLLNSNSALHCSVDDNHDSVWDNRVTMGETATPVGPAVCWENVDPNVGLPKYWVLPPGDVKGTFVACAITDPGNPDACRTKMGGILSAQTTLTGGVSIGQTTVQVADVSGFTVGDWVRLNPGGANQEDNQIVGFGSIHLALPLLFHHDTGEPVGRILPSAAPVPVRPPVNSLGDTNCDGRIDGADIIAILNVGIDAQPSSACIDNGDVDGDGSITPYDALLVLKFWAGVIGAFPALGP